MFTRGLVLCLTLAVVSMAQAGVVIELDPPTTIVPPGGMSVPIYATQTGGPDPMLVRMVQLDFAASDVELVLSAPGTSDTIVEMWDYESASDCPIGGTCGDAHLIDSAFPVVVSAYGDADHLGADATLQMNLVDSLRTKIGEVFVECDGTGVFTLDALNAADQDPDLGASLLFGFGVNIDGTPITTWKAADGDVTGSSVELTCDVVPVDLVDSNYPCDMSLTRTGGHVLRLMFDGDISVPAAGQLMIQELAAGGAFTGPDLSDQFTFTVEGGTTLRIAENGTVLANEAWYGIYNAGTWPGVGAFEMDYVVVIGDVNDSGFTNFSDLAVINQNLSGSSADDDVYDINASGFVNFSDIAAANQFGIVPASEAPDKPDGHVCTLP